MKNRIYLVEKMIHQMHTCVGCRNCVIACSYHHKKVFSRAESSLEVTELKGKNQFAIIVHRKNENDHIGCNRCAGLDEPTCVKYCPSIAKTELKNILQEVWLERF